MSTNNFINIYLLLVKVPTEVIKMSEDLENLEKSFILDDDMEHENIKELIQKIQLYCRIDKNGFVVIDDKVKTKLIIPDRVTLVMAARHLANRLQQKLGKEPTIKEDVPSQELADMLKEKRAVIDARLKDLKDKKEVLPVSRGVYKIAPYTIPPFLKRIEKGEKA
ncbi:MAG: hypothetical protein ABIJ34_01985 [archaeon]